MRRWTCNIACLHLIAQENSREQTTKMLEFVVAIETHNANDVGGGSTKDSRYQLLSLLREVKTSCPRIVGVGKAMNQA